MYEGARVIQHTKSVPPQESKPGCEQEPWHSGGWVTSLEGRGHQDEMIATFSSYSGIGKVLHGRAKIANRKVVFCPWTSVPMFTLLRSLCGLTAVNNAQHLRPGDRPRLGGYSWASGKFLCTREEHLAVVLELSSIWPVIFSPDLVSSTRLVFS